MAPGNPPRHSKNTEEPVTIDLDAQEFASAKDAETKADKPSEAPDTNAADEPPAQPDLTSEPLPEETLVAAAEPSPEPHEPSNPVPPAPPAAPPHSGTSGLIAAGIVGGLIALVGAGAIQYAGYLPSSSAPATPSADVANFSAEIDGLKQSVANLAAAPPTSDTGALEQRIAALEATTKNPPAAADTTAVDALNQKIADLTGQVDQLRGAVTQASDSADIEQRLAEAEKKLNEPRQDVAVARAIAAAALKAAIDRGGPFVAELDTFAGVSPMIRRPRICANLRRPAFPRVPSWSARCRMSQQQSLIPSIRPMPTRVGPTG